MKLCFQNEGIFRWRGGLLLRLIAAQSNRASIDIETAPDIPDARKCVIQMEWRPVTESGLLMAVGFTASVKGVLPTRAASGVMTVGKLPTGQKQFFFEEDAPDNPDQLSLLDGQDSIQKGR